MARKKKERFAPVQFSLLSLVCLLLCWTAVTALAFLAGYGLGNAERMRTTANRSPLFERSGGTSTSVGLTFPHILGHEDTDPQPPEALPLASPPPEGAARLVPSGAEPERDGAESAPVARVPGGLRTESSPGYAASGDRLIQVASFRDATKAEGLRGVLERKGYRAFTRAAHRPDAGEAVHRVFVGPFSTQEQAEKAKADLESGGGFHGVFIRTGAP